MHDGDDVAELALKGGVEVGTALDGSQAVAVCQFGEHADVAAVFELNACGGDVSNSVCQTMIKAYA